MSAWLNSPRRSNLSVAIAVSLLALTLTTATAARAENLLRNAGFLAAGSGEVPDYWSWQNGPIERPDWPGCWRLDIGRVVPGTRSMRLADDRGKSVRLLSFYYRLLPGKDYAFSAYLKADREGVRVTMYLGDVKPNPNSPGTGCVNSQSFFVGTGWKRYTVSGSVAQTERFHSCVAFQLEGNATIWINAPQLEEGARPTVFALSPRDGSFPNMPPVGPHEVRADDGVCSLDRSFYTTEKQAKLWIQTERPGLAQISFRGTARSFEVDGKEAAVALQIAALPDGDYPVEVTVAGVSRRIILRKLPPAAYAVKIDRLHRMLLCDGQPSFIPFATTASTAAEVDDLADNGFNTVITLLLHEIRPELYRALIDRAEARGMKVILWFHIASREPFEKWRDGILPLVQSYKTHPALLAWYLIDEPPVTQGWVKSLVDAVKAADPYHPAFVNWAGRQWVRAKSALGGDFECEDVYPVGRMPNDDAMKLIAGLVGAMNRDAVCDGKMIAFWHGLYGSYDSPREPTPLEAQCLTYTSLVHGCHAHFYYLYKPMSVALWQSMRPLAQEIQALAPAVNGEDISRDISVNNPAIHFAAFQTADGRITLIAVNTTGRSQSGCFRLRLETRGDATVLFEHRTLSSGMTIADDFEGLQRHVYCWCAEDQPAWKFCRPHDPLVGDVR